MKKIITYILLLSIIVSCTKDELNILPPAVDWEMNIVGTNYINNDIVTINHIDQNIYALESTTDNGFVIAINGELRKYSSENDSLWQKNFSESVKAVQRLSNNEYLLCGSDETNLWISKVNQDWDIIWETLVPLNESASTFFAGIQETTNGIILGIRKNNGRFSHSRMLKLDNDGNLLWLNKFENIELAEIHGIEVGTDGDIFIAGGANKLDNTDTSPWFAKMDNNGNIVEQDIFTEDERDYFAGIQQRANDDFIVLIKDNYNTDVAFLKNGKINNRDFLNRSDFSTIDEMQNGEWIMIGQHSTNQFMGGVSASTSFAKLDNDGQRTWQAQLGSFGYDDWQTGMAACQLTDGSYVFLMLHDYYFGEELTYILTKTETN